MKNYVNFECIHIVDTDWKDDNENHAFAYADIDGYTEDENDEGVVICRVWLMCGKSSACPIYLVDWHHNGYYNNEAVIEVIKQAKEKLIAHRQNKLEVTFKKAYNRYRMEWMSDNGYTLEDLFGVLQKLMDMGAATIRDAFNEFETYKGFGVNNNIWKSEDVFREEDWEKEECMLKLLTEYEYSIWFNR